MNQIKSNHLLSTFPFFFSILKGVSAKTVFERQPCDSWKRFLPEVEIFLYNNFYVRTSLIHLLQPNREYLIFLNAEILFHKMSDIHDTIAIFSSYRTDRWVNVDHLSWDYRQGLADDMLMHFTRDFLADVEQVQNKRESGWVFQEIRQVNIVKIEREPLLGTFAKTRNHKYCELLAIPKKILLRCVAFPEQFMTQALRALNICVPGNLVLKLEFIKQGNLRNITRENITEALSFLRFRELLKPECEHKLAKADFQKLERLNSPFNEHLIHKYPFLAAFKGFSICLYRMIKCSHTYRLINTHLSTNWKNKDFLKVHLLETTNIAKNRTHGDHTILILSFNQFVAKFKYKKTKDTTVRACDGCLMPELLCPLFFYI